MRRTKPKGKRKSGKSSITTTSTSSSWVEHIAFEGVTDNVADNECGSTKISVISWNMLAQAYCKRRSQVDLPRAHHKWVFVKERRRQRILESLDRLVQTGVDVICLQEVDLDMISQHLSTHDFVAIETPRSVAGGAGCRIDACGVYVSNSCWQVVKHEMIALDDLATLTSPDSSNDGTQPIAEPPPGLAPPNGNGYSSDDDAIATEPVPSTTAASTNLQGFQQSFLRRNQAILVRLRHPGTGRTVVIANCHLYWNPAYDYVKLCQAHYMMQRAHQFCHDNEPVIFCGDWNAQPGGVVHQYVTRGHIHAKRHAPWYDIPENEDGDEDDDDDDDDQQQDADDHDEETKETTDNNNLVDDLHQLTVHDSTLPAPTPASVYNVEEEPTVLYILDASLNKLCRWLRILGLDTALETEQEELQRASKDGNPVIVLFQRARSERRVLVTASVKLLLRRDCPAAVYGVNPVFLPHLEVVLVHLLLTHGVTLDPQEFLGRCVICNGNIRAVHDMDMQRCILEKYEAPLDMLDEGVEVYQCDKDVCGQGYWWTERPTSAASRVKTTASHLFRICLRAGVPCRGTTVPDILEEVDIAAEQQQGWDYTLPGSHLLRHKLAVVDWLGNECLACPYTLRSAYHTDSNHVTSGELLPFTNVTADFVSTLDYIFYEQSWWYVARRLFVPTTFAELNPSKIANGHLLPSDVWPSDHLAIGVTLMLRDNQRRETPGT